ncbi:MAG: oxidoreductase [Candidatus Levybacteria bacterium CG_4_10_14_0_2_um_filter_36_16]|nr:MAG: hypothetical protein AUK12_02300 [Candidatus Levybacteria bacterium CG2_30_37_29]PIR79143.1 MAG: oxidoreductase [Candidatus Levybacteria bacterium CG10_big_fil_rev_8_21_14_0_10_36_30]PIZ96781.1 MAG: oxidoreductase [Candidatus Levybacteria bacterium CG_4_10_14_0_2_um_filter_36_16]PJA90663.1 MAG: oxidoreductase [Candidatus Levybacteria bacterium CG_4_9_14_3_um_filter_36_7]
MKVNIAVVGLGYWGPNLVRNFVTVPGASITTVCDTNPATFQKIKPFSSIKTVRNINDVLRDKTIDAVAIATPLSTHFILAKKAILAGKHVLLEKPMTQTSIQSQELIKLAEKNKRILMVGHTFIYSQAVRQIKKIIKRKDFGQVYYFDSTRINLGILQKDSNVIWDLAPHDFSIINYLFDTKPISLLATGSHFVGKKYEEIAHIVIKYENNINAYINLSWLSPVKIRSIFIGGSKKMIVYDDIQPSEKIKIYNKRIKTTENNITPFSPAYRSGEIIIPNLEQKEALLTEIEHFVECIQMNKKPLTGGLEGLKVVKLLEIASESLKTNLEVIIK